MADEPAFPKEPVSRGAASRGAVSRRPASGPGATGARAKGETKGEAGAQAGETASPHAEGAASAQARASGTPGGVAKAGAAKPVGAKPDGPKAIRGAKAIQGSKAGGAAKTGKAAKAGKAVPDGAQAGSGGKGAEKGAGKSGAKTGAAGKAKGASVKRAVARAVAAAAPPIPYAPEEIAEIFRRFAVQRANPTSELEHRNTFTLLVAVVLSAQMTDAGVNRATRGLFSRASTPEAMAALGEDEIREAIRTIGFFRTKAGNVQRLSEILRDRFGGEVPRSREALEALPGVGRKTANVIMNTAFGEETLAVDTHILRLGNRLKIAPGKTPEAVEAGFLRIIPEGYLRHAHHWLILHGRFVCKARKPDCEHCVIADLCRADEKRCDRPAPLIALPDAPPGPQPLPPGATRPGG